MNLNSGGGVPWQILLGINWKVIVGFLASPAVGESKCIAKASASRKIPELHKTKSRRRIHTNISSNMQTTDEYKAAVSNAVAFKHENPDEKATTAARIHHVNAIAVRSNLRREEIYGGKEVKHGGHNKMLSDTQVEAIYQYVEDSYLSGYSATKVMVYAAIGCLKANQLPTKEPPS